MNKYYMIPLKSFNTKINDIKLDDFLKNTYPSVYDAIEDLIIYNDLVDDLSEEDELNDREYFEKYLAETLEQLDLPYYILAQKTDSGVIECETKTPIKIDGISEDNYQCSKERFKSYYNDEYIGKIINLFTLTEEMVKEEKKTI